LRRSIRHAVAQFEEIMRQAEPALSPKRVRAKLMTEMAISTGMLLLAQLTDLAWNLPFDVVLVPWRNAAS
jgi:Cu/Ag efflux pump CusA